MSQVPQFLPISYAIPGVYVFLSRAGATPPPANKKVLLLSYKTSAGSAKVASPQRILSETDVVNGAGTGSGIHRIYRSFVAQNSSTGADLWMCPLAPPSGAAQTRLIQFLQSPVGAVLGTGGTGALAAGYVTTWVCGVRYDTTIATGDTYAVIAADVCAQIQANQDMLPCTASVSGDTLTLTARHAALSSADMPVMVTFSNTQMGVSASPGTITFTTTAAANGNATTSILPQVAQSSFLSGATAAQITAGHITAINSTAAFPVTAAQPSTPGAVVTLIYAADSVFNWASTSITTAATTTMVPAWGASASGLPSSATPSLADALGMIDKDTYKLWVTDLTGAGSTVAATGITQAGSTSDYSVMSTISSQIEQAGGGISCKGQIVLFSDTRSLAVAGSIPSGTTPALTLSPRYFMGWCPGSPQQAVESAARCASIVMSQIDYPNFNYAGYALQTDNRTPYLLPNAAVRPSDSDCNAAMLTYFMAPLRSNDSGQMCIMSGRTTAKPSAALDYRYSFWGVSLADDFIRDDLRAFLPGVIQGKNLKIYGESHTQFTVTPDALMTAVASRMEYYDSLDIFDGASDLIPALVAEVNPSVPSRIDIKLPKRFAIPAEQVAVYTQMAA